MKVKTVPSSWLGRDGRRLDCGPYTSGALEAKIRLEELDVPKERLAELTSGHEGGIYNGPHFSRSWVESPEHGVPFLGSAAVLMADLSNLPLLRRRDAESPKISHLRVDPGMTLISCSGTIGRMVYARPDMTGMWTSQHIMKVSPDPDRVSPGYVYAFLSSKFGVPIVVSGTYGSIIQSIEPQHIADLPVPRLGDEIERRAHELVQHASETRSLALDNIREGEAVLAARLALPILSVTSVAQFSTTTVPSSTLKLRFDAPYHCHAASDADSAVAAGPFPRRCLAEVVKRYFKPPMFKRLWVEGGEYGQQFISGVDAYRFQAETIRYVSNRTPKFNEFILEEGTVIFQAAGQIHGLFGQPLLVVGWLTGLFAADDLYRLVPNSLEDGAYLYGFFRTPHGQVLLKRQACGNSIPRIWDPHIRNIFIPWPDEEIRAELGAPFLEAHRQLEKARRTENEALALVERAIEEAT